MANHLKLRFFSLTAFVGIFCLVLRTKTATNGTLYDVMQDVEDEGYTLANVKGGEGYWDKFQEYSNRNLAIGIRDRERIVPIFNAWDNIPNVRSPSLFPTSSAEPSGSPSSMPSGIPSLDPSVFPSNVPSGVPSSIHSNDPSAFPSNSPSNVPSSMPSNFASDNPSITPFAPPSSYSSTEPSEKPTITSIDSTLPGVLLHSDTSLYSNEKPIVLRSHGVSLVQQNNGNLAIYDGTTEGGMIRNNLIWETGVDSPLNTYRTVCQSDGHLITRNVQRDIVWKNRKTGIDDGRSYFFGISPDLTRVFVVEGTPENIVKELWSSRTSVPELLPPGQPSDTITFEPGFLSVIKHGYRLSAGLNMRIIARKNEKIELVGGLLSDDKFHRYPDAGACFPHPDGPDKGYVYVSNSEDVPGSGGVGGIYFNEDGMVVNYKPLLTGSTKNCGGGKTPWGTWVSCEEYEMGDGIWQVNPWPEPGMPMAQLTTLGEKNSDGKRGGMWESFTYDTSYSDGVQRHRYYFSDDSIDGAVRRYTPKLQELRWDALHGDGVHDYLILTPGANLGQGTFSWTSNLGLASENAKKEYPHVEGIDFWNGHLYFVSKEFRQLYDLDLTKNTYNITKTTRPFTIPDQLIHLDRNRRRLGEEKEFQSMFGPTQISRILSNGKAPNLQEQTTNSRDLSIDGDSPIFFFTEDASHPGIFGMDMSLRFFTILETTERLSPADETTGVAFSPDKKRMYFCQQKAGICFEVWREDGHSFIGKYLNIKHH